MIIVLSIAVHLRLQNILFNHDTINGTFNKWDDTIRGSTLWLRSLEAQSGLMLLHVNTCDITDRIRTEYRKNIDRETNKHRHKIDKEYTQNRTNIGRK